MGWIPDNVIAAMRGSYQLGIFLRIDTDPELHLWFGVSDIQAGIDSVDAEGTIYLGGRLLNVPQLEVLVNGQADNVEFGISGIDPATANEMLLSIPSVRGCTVQIGITTLDDYYQPTSAIIPIWWGTASHVSEASEAAPSDQSQTLTLSLSVATGQPTRSRPSYALWSSSMQKAISPTDLFCDSTSRLARGVTPVWPNY